MQYLLSRPAIGKPAREFKAANRRLPIGYPLCVVLVLAVAVALRCLKLWEWSLWDDEQTSIYFALRLERPFPNFFPLFFLALRGFFAVAGVSIEAGRTFAAALGLASIVLAFLCFRKLCSRPVALVAALLLAINLGHLFWSQSIRYYTLLVMFQILSIYWFITGFERGRAGLLLLSNLAFLAAMLTHYSALLLAPVYIVYLAIVRWRRESGEGYNLKHYLVFGLPFLIILAVFSVRILQARRIITGYWIYASAVDPVHVLISVVAYFGVPVVALGLLAPAVSFRLPKRIVLFLLAVSGLPILELAVLVELRWMGVCWYYALVSLFGFSGLAAICLVSLYQRRRRLASLLLGAATVVYYAGFLTAYYTTMHGDRARWNEATAFLRQETNATATNDSPEVFATFPGLVAYYLGVDPAQIMEDRRVHGPLRSPPTQDPGNDQWYVVEAHMVSRANASWFAAHCTLEKRFEAHTGPMDRSLLVYHYKPRAFLKGNDANSPVE
jgi:hypothetical protein